MSAFVVSHEHIAALVGTYCAMRAIEEDSSDPLELARTLYLENARSCAALYPTDPTYLDQLDEESRAFTVEQIRAWELAPLSIGQFLRALSCYSYNACERDQWHQSEAFRLCERMSNCAAERLPDYYTCPYGIVNPAPLRAVKPLAYELERSTKFAAKLNASIDSNELDPSVTDAIATQQQLTLTELRELNSRLRNLATACLDSLPPDASATLTTLLAHFTIAHVLSALVGVVRTKAGETIETEPHHALELNRVANLIEIAAKRINL